jgi:hypothetical protein
MKVLKHRRGKPQRGKYWYIPDSWKGPFGSNDSVSFETNEKGEWELVADIIRNDGDGDVCITGDGLPKIYKLPKWLQNAIEEVYKTGRHHALGSIQKLIMEKE